MVVDAVNRLLADEDDRLTASFGPPKLPVVFLFSQPRSASTMFTQVAFSTLRVSYVTNMLSRFYRAPYIGAMMEKGIADPRYTSTFRTKHITLGAHEPHEWGWFWRHWLRLGEDEYYCAPDRSIDGTRLASKLGALESVTGTPWIFDNTFAQVNFDLLRPFVRTATVVYTTRDPYYVCNSLLNARLDRHKDVRAWYGPKPRDIERILALTDPVEQVVAQVHSLEVELDAQVARLPAADVLRCSYDELVNDPAGAAESFARFLDRHGANIVRRTDAPAMRFESRNRPEFVNPEFKHALDRHFVRYFPSRAPAGAT